MFSSTIRFRRVTNRDRVERDQIPFKLLIAVLDANGLDAEQCAIRLPSDARPAYSNALSPIGHRELAIELPFPLRRHHQHAPPLLDDEGVAVGQPLRAD